MADFKILDIDRDPSLHSYAVPTGTMHALNTKHLDAYDLSEVASYWLPDEQSFEVAQKIVDIALDDDTPLLILVRDIDEENGNPTIHNFAKRRSIGHILASSGLVERIGKVESHNRLWDKGVCSDYDFGSLFRNNLVVIDPVELHV